MKKHIFTTLFIICSLLLIAQAPELINYQSIIRSSNGTPLINKDFSIRISIYQYAPNGDLVYQEEHAKTTNSFGLINLKIGEGNTNFGSISGINWANGPYFVETAIDSTENFNFITIGNSQLLSVPYALHANTVENSDDADADPTNEIQDLIINGNQLSIENGNSINIPLDGIWNYNENDIYYNNGFVGVGTQIPENKLHIESKSNMQNGRILLKLKNTSTDTHATTQMSLESGNDNGSVLSIAHVSDNYTAVPNRENVSHIWNKGRGLSLRSTNTNDASIRFETNLLEEITERMRIDAFGNVGIGTNNPSNPLHIEGMSNGLDGRTFLSIHNNSTDMHSGANMRIYSGSNDDSFLHFSHKGESYTALPNWENTSAIWNKGNGLFLISSNGENSSIRFCTNTINAYTERMRIDAFGNVGIGTETPSSKLHIAEGDIYMENIYSGIILKSPNGECWKISVNNDGSISTTSIECP